MGLLLVGVGTVSANPQPWLQEAPTRRGSGVAASGPEQPRRSTLRLFGPGRLGPDRSSSCSPRPRFGQAADVLTLDSHCPTGATDLDDREVPLGDQPTDGRAGAPEQ